jgi:GT2 family glycosyltransferase
MAEPTVTIVVVPREQFSKTQVCLEAIFEHSRPPFSLIYVDGNSPPRHRRYLEAQAKARNFRLIRLEHYLPGNQARNLALQHVTTKYVVFLDNDVLVSPDWLDPLVDCAEKTGAWVVGPLYCMEDPKDEIIHTAGAEFRIVETEGKRRVHTRHFLCGKRVPEVRQQLKRQRIDLVEFHCLLARTEALQRMGGLDELLLSYLDYMDLCLMVAAAGGTVFTEPRSVVTYLRPSPFAWSDLPCFLLRWSNRWLYPSLDHFSAKHRIDPGDPDFFGHMEYQQQQRARLFGHPRKIIRRHLGELALQEFELAIDRLCDRIVVARAVGGSRAARHRPTSHVAQAVLPRRPRLAELIPIGKDALRLWLDKTGHLRRLWRDQAGRDSALDPTGPAFVTGFSFAEAGGRWTDGKFAVMELPVDAPPNSAVQVKLRVSPFYPPGTASFRFQTLGTGGAEKNCKLTPADGLPAEFVVDARAVGTTAHKVVIALRLIDARSPMALELCDDARRLGLFVHHAEILPSKHALPRALPAEVRSPA